jgi:diaminohydroxyphosphoribosylaminopyrimidine deaminase/5-amino-6-(5-phosphoribosylamino)uracil reductase
MGAESGSGAEDRRWMRRALTLAKRAWGRTSPNPLVGAVLVRDGVTVGEGWHQRAGTAHAEVHAIAAAGEHSAGSTLYVTLEPCCTQGRTPPCTAAIQQAGIARVVVGCQDANPRHAGQGLHLLRSAGIAVSSGVLQEACQDLNEGFFWWIRQRRPFVVLKMAMTLDGRIATAAGESRWITGLAARQRVQRLRQWADAVMVGGATVRADNPALTVRAPARWPRQPQRCVWTAGALPMDRAVWDDPERPPIVAKPVSRAQWVEFLDDLGRRELTTLLLEGGGELAAAALRAGVVNKVAFFVAPRLLGGRGSRPVVGGADPARLEEAMSLQRLQVAHVGQDLLVTGYCTHVYGAD